MKKFLLAVAIWLLVVPMIRAQGVEEIPEEAATKYGGLLAELADKIVEPAIKVTADASKAKGVHVPEKMGLLVAPQKDLKESEELAAKFKEEKGTPIGYLFLYHVTPIAKEKKIAADQLWDVTVTDEEGTTRKINVLLLAVRQLADDDYRLYAYGKDKQPIIDAKFSEGAGGSDGPVAVSVRDTNEQTHEGTIVITVFGKYEATFRGGHVE